MGIKHAQQSYLRILAWIYPEAKFGEVGIKHAQQRYVLTVGIELLGHLEGYQPSEGIAAETIRPFWLHSPYLLKVVSRHLLNTGAGRLLAIQPFGLEPIKWLIRIQM